MRKQNREGKKLRGDDTCKFNRGSGRDAIKMRLKAVGEKKRSCPDKWSRLQRPRSRVCLQNQDSQCGWSSSGRRGGMMRKDR